MQILRT